MHPSAQALRDLGTRLADVHGRVAHNAAHHLDVLADLLDGVPRDLAGQYCCRCGSRLAEGGAFCKLVSDADESFSGEEAEGGRVFERLCIGCHVESGEE